MIPLFFQLSHMLEGIFPLAVNSSSLLLSSTPTPKILMNEKKMRFLPILPGSNKEIKQLLSDKHENLDGKTFTSMLLSHF